MGDETADDATSNTGMTFDDLISRIGKPVPCPLCGAPSVARRAVWLPNPVRTTWGGWITPLTCRWVCPRCPG